MLFEENDNAVPAGETEAPIEQGEDIIEWMDSEIEEAEPSTIRTLADDYGYFVKQLIDAGLRDSYAYEILKLVVNKQ